MITECAPVLGFEGQYKFLSNFYPSEVEFEFVKYPTVEHAYQAAKTCDYQQRMKIQQAITPGAAKRLGRSVTLRENWDSIKFQIMLDLVTQKFSKPPFSIWLKNTGDSYLEETNWWGDTYWGVCKGKGKNRLGAILMYVRQNLQDESI